MTALLVKKTKCKR